ncbi:uncharacterized protein LOC101778410 [Setaria italica]|uniref:uncharacterized protein LOC101778410 n=1 Tax=Setaria italica TaxID=4555 RepID=UPI0006483E81|nr:uncharacterized protein LOC101778410 [Setaria italica]
MALWISKFGRLGGRKGGGKIERRKGEAPRPCAGGAIPQPLSASLAGRGKDDPAAAVMVSNEAYTKRNAAGVLGLSSLQKITAAFQMLTYGVAADATNDYVRIGESTAIESLRRFVNAVVEVFGDEYLRSPNEDDTARLLSIGESRGFPDKDLWIWHAFFGMPGSHNDINVLHRSSLFARVAEGQAPKVNTINNNEYTMGYYLADGIYPSWATIVKSIPDPQGNKKKYFATAQEACRKDVERAFGVLQSRFAIVRGPARFWDEDTIGQIMRACVIMHNMILEDERDEEDDLNYDGVEKR